MIVKCVSLLPTLPQSVRLGRYFKPGEQEFPLEIGREYGVYGIRLWAGGAWVDIEVDAGYLVVVPLCLFEIIENSASATWTVRVDADGDVAILPLPLHDRYFHDDLIEGVAEARLAFNALKAEMFGDV